MVNFPTRIPDCDFHSLALLDLFLSSDASICFTMAFPPLGNSHHVIVSVSSYFPSNSKWDVLFHHIAYDYSCADWDSLSDHLRDLPWEYNFKLGAYAAASEYQHNKSKSKGKFRQGSNRCKRVFEAAKRAYANKTKESITSQKLGSRGFCRIANSVLNKNKSAIPPLFNGLKVLSSASDKAKLFAKNFSKNSNFEETCISLPVFPFKAILKLHNS